MNAFSIGQIVKIDSHEYKIERTITGGMGLVLFLKSCHQRTSIVYRDRLAAKVFFDDLNSRQVINELKIWDSLSHAHIVRLITITHVNHWLCAIMPWYSEGGITFTTDDKMKLKNTRQMLSDVASALDYASKSGVLHLDIKPANIFSRTDDFQKGKNDYAIGDWGISQICAQKALNLDFRFSGTLPYMPPERFLVHQIDLTSDIYALGMTSLQLLTNQLPFINYEIDSVRSAILDGSYLNGLDFLIRDIPKNWALLILNCCQFYPKNRPQNYKDFIALLNKVEI